LATGHDAAVFRNTPLVRTTAHGHLAVERLLADLRKDGAEPKSGETPIKPSRPATSFLKPAGTEH
jgi:hypothetical protein